MSGKKNISGLSMLEIIISMVILALVLVGLVNVFVISRSYVAHSSSRVNAGQLGKFFLDPLQNDVREDTWNASGNKLNVTAGEVPGSSISTVLGPQTISNVLYTPKYEISEMPMGNGVVRKVKVNITWDEAKY